MRYSRYMIFTYDEFVRLWCEEHYTERGEELGLWSDTAGPVSVAEIVALCAQHELAEHSEPSFTDAHTQPGLLSS